MWNSPFYDVKKQKKLDQYENVQIFSFIILNLG